MKIVPISPKLLEKSVASFVREYSEAPERKWNLATAQNYLKRNIEAFSEFCWAAVNEKDEFLGAIFCRLDPYYESQYLFLDSIIVEPNSRNQGIAKTLLQKVVIVAKSHGVSGIHKLIDDRKGFPKDWYEKLGFRSTGWIEYEVKIEDLNI